MSAGNAAQFRVGLGVASVIRGVSTLPANVLKVGLGRCRAVWRRGWEGQPVL